MAKVKGYYMHDYLTNIKLLLDWRERERERKRWGGGRERFSCWP